MKKTEVNLEVDFPCLDRFYGQDLGKRVRLKDIEDPARLVLLKHSGRNSATKYPCGHKIDDYMVFRCPETLRQDCASFVVSSSVGTTELRNFIVFDPNDTVRERTKIRGQCPRCFFLPHLLNHPVCCKCGGPISKGEQVFLSDYTKKASRMLGVMRVRGRSQSKLVRCTHGACGSIKEKGTLFIWNGKMLVSLGSPEEQALRIVLGAEKFAHACKGAFAEPVPAPPRLRRSA